MSKNKSSRAKKRAAAQRRNASPTPRHEQQYALIGTTLFDIEQAHRILRTTRRRLVHIDVDTWARLYGMDGNPHSPIALGALFDPAHAKTANLNRPLILITLTTSDARETLLIADGSHRLFRAFTERRGHLPAYILTAAETRAITISRPTNENHPAERPGAHTAHVRPAEEGNPSTHIKSTNATTNEGEGNVPAATLVAAIDTALRAEHWKPAKLRTPPCDMLTAAWTRPDRTTHLVITHAPGEPTTADLTGHPVGHAAEAI